MQAKGSLMDWQCAKCGTIEYNMRTKNDLKINYIRGECTEQPHCSKCHSIVRPNISMRDDLDWIDRDVNQQLQRLQDYFMSPAIKPEKLQRLEM